LNAEVEHLVGIIEKVWKKESPGIHGEWASDEMQLVIERAKRLGYEVTEVPMDSLYCPFTPQPTKPIIGKQ
jgi:hypothetical protein